LLEDLEQQSIELFSICVSTADLIQHSTRPQEHMRRQQGESFGILQHYIRGTGRKQQGGTEKLRKS
jgi:hypothetical protein